MKKRQIDKDYAALMAKTIALTCVRNTYLEELHAGDIKTSKISQEEMKILMKEVVNCIYEFILNIDNEEFLIKKMEYAQRCTGSWDEPSLAELDKIRKERCSF